MSDDLTKRISEWESQRPDPSNRCAWQAWLNELDRMMPYEPPPKQMVRKEARGSDLMYRTTAEVAQPQPEWRREPDLSVEVRADMSDAEFEEAIALKWRNVFIDAVQIRNFVNQRIDDVGADLEAVDARFAVIEDNIAEIFQRLTELESTTAVERAARSFRPKIASIMRKPGRAA
jgi:hypothetical protein